MPHSEYDIERRNAKEATYPEMRVWWYENRNWTSDVWERLSKEGWRTKSAAGLITVYDDAKAEVGTWFGRVNMLFGVGKLLR